MSLVMNMYVIRLFPKNKYAKAIYSLEITNVYIKPHSKKLHSKVHYLVQCYNYDYSDREKYIQS